MSLSQIDFFAAGAAMLAVWMCGVTRVQTQVWGVALQTTLLAAICVLLSARPEGAHFLVLAGVVLLVKAIGIPLFLTWTVRRQGVARDTGTRLGPTLVLLLACVLLAFGYFLAPQFAVPGLGNAGAAGMALTLLLVGMLLMITRRLALSQVIGFLVLENGIFLYGLTQTHGMPMLVEMGVVFEVLVAVLVAQFVITRLNRSFTHTDVTQLRGLRH